MNGTMMEPAPNSRLPDFPPRGLPGLAPPGTAEPPKPCVLGVPLTVTVASCQGAACQVFDAPLTPTVGDPS